MRWTWRLFRGSGVRQVLDGSDLVYIVWIKSNSDWTSFVVVVVSVVIVNSLVSML